MSSGSGGSGQTSSMTDGNNISTPDTPDEVMEEAIPVDAEQLTIIRSGSTLNDNVEVDEAYAGAANKKQQLMDAGMDLERQDATRRGFAIPSTADEIKEANARWGEDAWQMKALRFINSDGVQRFLIFLLVLDVLILFTELGELKYIIYMVPAGFCSYHVHIIAHLLCSCARTNIYMLIWCAMGLPLQQLMHSFHPVNSSFETPYHVVRPNTMTNTRRHMKMQKMKRIDSLEVEVVKRFVHTH